MTAEHPVDVHLLLVHEGQLLLSRRRDADAAFTGMWHLPSGKLEADESAPVGLQREAIEELGVHVDTDDLRHVHTAHVTASGRPPRLGLFFEARTWSGRPSNREPTKCSALSWFALDALPTDIIAYPAAGIHGYRTGLTFSTHGWPRPQD